MSNITLFGNQSGLPTVRRESKLASQRPRRASGGLRRLATNTNGTFKRIVEGQQVGKAIPHEIDVIIVSHMPDISREFYAKDYDPDAKPTLPDCWSNHGDKPEAAASNPQSTSCASCPKNIKGSGKGGKGKACRYKRRVAVLGVGDPSGDIYQMSFAGGSLFGEGNAADEYPFEAYLNFLDANEEYTDTVVTKVKYDLDSDTMKLCFKAIRHLTQEEADMVDAAQADPGTEKYVMLTVAQADGVTAKPEPEAKPAPKGKPSLAEWAAAADAEDAEDAEEEEVAAPVKRAKVEAAPAPKAKGNLANVLSEWGDED